MGDVMSVAVTPIIEAKDPKTAAGLAIEQKPELLVEAFDYHRIAEDTKPYLEFVRE